MTRSHFGSIEYVGPGSYRVWWTDKSGKRRSHRMRDATREDAEMFLAMQKTGRRMPPDTTWGQFWEMKVWPQVMTLAVNTQDDYEATWRNHLEPQIGDEPVREMDWERANEVITSVPRPAAQRKAGRLLKKMCNMAVRDRSRLLDRCPVDSTIEYMPHRKRRKALVDVSDVAAYMAAVRGFKHEAVMLALMGAGLRPEEADALLWEDVRAYGFKGSTYCAMDVCKALTWTRSRGKVLKDTKNTSSERVAVCGEPWASRILELSEGRSGPLSPSGEPYDPDEPEAWYTSPLVITQKWKKWCGRRGVAHVTRENMRSGYATMMGEALVPDSVVAGNMGHSDGTTKGTHYQRVTMRAKCMAADALADLVAECNGDLFDNS